MQLPWDVLAIGKAKFGSRRIDASFYYLSAKLILFRRFSRHQIRDTAPGYGFRTASLQLITANCHGTNLEALA